jgi:hypothetical protein
MSIHTFRLLLCWSYGFDGVEDFSVYIFLCYYVLMFNGLASRLSCPVISVFLGTFAKLRKATISFITSVCLPVRLSTWNNSVPTRQILIKLDV